MSEPERLDVLILGSGQGGKVLAWHMAGSGRRTASVERRYVGGSCPNIACMPSKNEVWSARVAHQVRRGSSARRPVQSQPTWPRSASANATWSTARSPRTCRTTRRAAPN